MPWIALVCDISGVCRVVGTLEMTSKPTKAARTKIVSSVIRSMRGPPWARSLRGPLVADLAAMRDACAGDDVVLEVDVEAAVLAYQQAEQVLEVLGVELRGGNRHLGRQVAGADDLDAALDDRLPRPGQLAVAAGLGGEVDDHRAGLHGAHGVGGDQARRRAAGDRGGGDDDVLLGDVLADRLDHLVVLLVGERARVAALAFGVGDEVQFQRPAAERGDLLPGGAADVEAGDDRAEP